MLVAQRIEIPEHRSGNVAGEKLGSGVALQSGEIPGGIYHSQVGLVEVLGEPRRADERAGERRDYARSAVIAAVRCSRSNCFMKPTRAVTLSLGQAL